MSDLELEPVAEDIFGRIVPVSALNQHQRETSKEIPELRCKTVRFPGRQFFRYDFYRFIDGQWQRTERP